LSPAALRSCLLGACSVYEAGQPLQIIRQIASAAQHTLAASSRPPLLSTMPCLRCVPACRV
jgi:hypothetical protein